MASLMGAKVHMVSKVGNDDVGRATVANFNRHGVLTDHLTVVDGVASGIAAVSVASDGQNSIVVAPGANLLLSRADVERAADAILQSDVLLLQNEVSPVSLHEGTRHQPARTHLNFIQLAAIFREYLQAEAIAVTQGVLSKDIEASPAAAVGVAAAVVVVVAAAAAAALAAATGSSSHDPGGNAASQGQGTAGEAGMSISPSIYLSIHLSLSLSLSLSLFLCLSLSLSLSLYLSLCLSRSPSRRAGRHRDATDIRVTGIPGFPRTPSESPSPSQGRRLLASPSIPRGTRTATIPFRAAESSSFPAAWPRQCPAQAYSPDSDHDFAKRIPSPSPSF
jgi:hypothetical protein